MEGIKKLLKDRPIVQEVLRQREARSAAAAADAVRTRVQQELLAAQLLAAPRYDDVRRLTRHGAQVFSQNEEDGMIAEVFRRIGTGTKTFVECGVGDGLENNTAYLLLRGWRGYWFEFNDHAQQAIARTFAGPIAEGRLRVAKEFLTQETAGAAFERCGVPTDLDLLSLDIDRNTSYLWRALAAYRPRLAVVEYNASIPAADDWEVPYDPQAVWQGTLYFGASLKALERIGRSLGYSLVGCDLSGVNAFFVRDDLLGDAFAAPYTAEHHYEPPRYYLSRTTGHPRGFA